MPETDKMLARFIALWFALSIALISFIGQLAAIGQPVQWGTVKAKASFNGVVYVLVVEVGGEDYALRADLVSYLRYRRGARVPLVEGADRKYQILKGVMCT